MLYPTCHHCHNSFLSHTYHQYPETLEEKELINRNWNLLRFSIFSIHVIILCGQTNSSFMEYKKLMIQVRYDLCVDQVL